MRPEPALVRVSRTIQADAERLFDEWTIPTRLTRWWRQEGEGWSFASAKVDLRVGGRYRLAMTAPDGKVHAAVGVYRHIERPVRLVFTWDWEAPANSVGETKVTVDFRKVNANATEVVITHERFADRARMARHEQGWIELLRLLERAVE